MLEAIKYVTRDLFSARLGRVMEETGKTVKAESVTMLMMQSKAAVHKFFYDKCYAIAKELVHTRQNQCLKL